MSDWKLAPHVRAFEEMWRQQSPDTPVPRRYCIGDPNEPIVNALINREPLVSGDADLRWHISISRPDQLPAWGDLVSAAHELRPGVVFVVGIPPRSWWINVHPYVLHLWETRDPHLVETWRFEGRGDPHT